MNTDRGLRLGAAVAAAVFLGHAGAAWAGELTGLSLGARVGYGIPMGDARASISLGDVVSGQVPVQLDATWRFDRSWRLGLYVQYGFASVAGAFCPAGASCSGQNFRLGAQTAYAFEAGDSSPWVGAGLGLEWQSASVSTGAVKNEIRLFGFEILNLQAGWDFRPAAGFSVGPFASFSLGQYQTATSGGVSENLATALHEWLELGVRGAFDF